ncbi:uncharacterized protein BXZ73DRAFT_91094 [Epithele typhae]|uniref:uncharacterized protein n=1 Tax=Epithele typhae TaxID=378194 RepID=UPI0020077CD9|nr:uncharacterized protein BXZ73DRAFT_91094 [Epithele typhae]KAH9925694.1 hypothetical protein BXZ73DRAFT_91094 [Epithele typhae]
MPLRAHRDSGRALLPALSHTTPSPPPLRVCLTHFSTISPTTHSPAPPPPMFFSKTKSSAPAPHTRASSAASPTTTATPPAYPSELATLQYQQDLLRDFWSGSAAGPLPPPPVPVAVSPTSADASRSSSFDLGEGQKTKWGSVILGRSHIALAAAPVPKPLSRTLFLFGLTIAPHTVCPLLWFVGAFFLFRPPAPRAVELNALPFYTVAERERRVAAYRAAEERWAKRCLWAAVAVLAIAGFVAGGAVMAARGAKQAAAAGSQ